MSEEVPMHLIEGIVGSPRHPTQHIARAVTEEERVYILHSENCESFVYGISLLDCKYSVALTRGIDLTTWEGSFDVPVIVRINLEGELIPRKKVPKSFTDLL